MTSIKSEILIEATFQFKKGNLIAIAPNASLSHYNIKNLEQCFYSLKSDNNLLEVKGFKHLSVFQVKKDY